MSDQIIDQLVCLITDSGFFAKQRNVDEYPYAIMFATEVDDHSWFSGTTFWACLVDDNWYLASWGMRYWRLPEKCDIEDLVLDLLRTGEGIAVQNKQIIDKYGLSEIEYSEFPT